MFRKMSRRKRKRAEQHHSIGDYEKTVATIRSSGLTKRRKKQLVRRVVNKMVDML